MSVQTSHFHTLLPLSLSHTNTEREGDRHTTKKVMRLPKTEYTYEFEG